VCCRQGFSPTASTTGNLASSANTMAMCARHASHGMLGLCWLKLDEPLLWPCCSTVFSACTYKKPGMSMVSAQPLSDWCWGCADAEVVAAVKKAAEAAASKLP
jgi:hypothetical protein